MSAMGLALIFVSQHLAGKRDGFLVSPPFERVVDPWGPPFLGPEVNLAYYTLQKRRTYDQVGT